MGEKSAKVQKWFKENIPTVAIIVMCIVYVIYGFIHIDQTGKTPFEIIADGAISFGMGFGIKCLFNAQGIANGEKANEFLETKELYGNILEEISTFQQYLPKYCKIQNDALIEETQMNILKAKFLDFGLFKKGYYRNKEVLQNLTKKEKLTLKRLENLKVNLINPSILLSDCEITIHAGRDLTANKKKYLRKSNTKTLIVMLISSLFFGIFSPTLVVDWAGIIWSLLQVAWFLGFGVMQYTNGYDYVLNEYRSVLKEKTSKLETFRNMYKADPEQFKEIKKDEVEIKPTIVLENNLTTNQVEDKKPTQTILEPLKQEIKVEEPIKSFEELIKEKSKEKSKEKVLSFEEFKEQMLERKNKTTN